MHRLVPGTAARVRTFARLTALAAAGLTGPASRTPLALTPPPHTLLALTPPPHTLLALTPPPHTLLTLTPPPHPMGFRPVQTSAADAAGGTVTETITSAYRTGR